MSMWKWIEMIWRKLKNRVGIAVEGGVTTASCVHTKKQFT